MTDTAATGSGQVPAESLEAATSDLERVREVLQSAARGQTGGTEVKEALQGYLDEHGQAIRAAASAVGEEVRLQALEQLYQWRAQLAAQFDDAKRTDPPASD
jgi:hypothetical protein